MNKKSLCPQCREEIFKGAKKCKHCGADLRNRFSKHPFITTLLSIIVLGQLLLGLFSSTNQTDNTDNSSIESFVDEENFKKDSLEICIFSQQRIEEEIKPLLKDPLSLELPSCSNNIENKDHIITKMPDGGILYESYYLSKNSFNATIKRNYKCAIQYQNYPNYTLNCGVIEE